MDYNKVTLLLYFREAHTGLCLSMHFVSRLHFSIQNTKILLDCLMYCAVTQISIELFYLFSRSLFWFSDPTYKSIKWQPKAAVWYFVSLFVFVFIFGVVHIKKILDLGWPHNLLMVRKASEFKHIKKSTVQLDPMGQLLVVLVAAFSWMIGVITQTSTDKWGEVKTQIKKVFPQISVSLFPSI